MDFAGHHRATIRKLAHEVFGVAVASEIAPVSRAAADRSVAVQPAEAAGENSDDTKLQTVRRALSDSAGRSRCEPHRAFIAAEVAKGRNAVAIYQDLVEHHGY